MTPRDDEVRFREIAFALVADDHIVIDVNGNRRQFRRGDQQAALDHIGPDRLCVCDDAIMFVAMLAGEIPAVSDPIWKLLDTCRLIDTRIAGRAIKRMKALCPAIPRSVRRGSIERRLDDLRKPWCEDEQQSATIPTRTERDWQFGPLGTGHETRVVVACFLADRRAENLVVTQAARSSAERYSAPDPANAQQVNRFLADRFRRLRDDWDEQLPPPRDENGQYSSDPRDWGLAGEADPRLVIARREWALRRYDLEPPQGRNTCPRSAASIPCGRTSHDYGGLRAADVTFRARRGETLLRIRLRDDRLRCYALLSLARSWSPPVWLHNELRAGRDPAAGYVHALAEMDIPPGKLPDGFLRLSETARIHVVRRLLDVIIGRLHEDAAAEYIAFGSDEAESLSREDRELIVRQIRWHILETGWFGLNSYLRVPVIERIASLVSDDERDQFSLGQDLRSAYAARHPGDDLTHWDERAARTFLGRPAGLGTPEGFWRILLDHCRDEGHRETIVRARQDPCFAKQILSERSVGLTGRIGPMLPVWQIRPVEVQFAIDEIRGQFAYAIVRSGSGLVAMDGSEFVCSVPSDSIRATISRLNLFLGRALQEVLGRYISLVRIVHAGVDIERLDEW